jgi:glucokinase
MTPPFFVGLDVGGTYMKAGVVDDAGVSLSRISMLSEVQRGQEKGLERMCETIDAAIHSAGLQRQQIAAIGVATPGTMDIPGGMILDPVNLKPWRNVPVRQYVQDHFGLPTAFQNDANAAALGEFWVGAGRNTRSLVLFTLGTGVGGGIILGGDHEDARVVEGEHSHGAELGHIKIEMCQPRQCGCGRYGCLEAYASATAVVKRTLEALREDGGRSVLHQLGKPVAEMTSRDVFDAAGGGDALASKIMEETAYYLGVGAMNLMHTINPEVIVFGGGMIAAGPAFLERIRHHALQLAFPVPAQHTRICYAELGNDAGFIGAAACGRLLYRRRQTAKS